MTSDQIRNGLGILISEPDVLEHPTLRLLQLQTSMMNKSVKGRQFRVAKHVYSHVKSYSMSDCCWFHTNDILGVLSSVSVCVCV